MDRCPHSLAPVSGGRCPWGLGLTDQRGAGPGPSHGILSGDSVLVGSQGRNRLARAQSFRRNAVGNGRITPAARSPQRQRRREATREEAVPGAGETKTRDSGTARVQTAQARGKDRLDAVAKGLARDGTRRRAGGQIWPDRYRGPRDAQSAGPACSMDKRRKAFGVTQWGTDAPATSPAVSAGGPLVKFPFAVCLLLIRLELARGPRACCCFRRLPNG